MRKKKVSCGKKTAVMALAVFLGTMLMTGCSSSVSGKPVSGEKPVVTVWAGGSDNVRVQFEKQIQQFNAPRISIQQNFSLLHRELVPRDCLNV